MRGVAIDLSEFESNLRRWYVADHLSRDEVRALHEHAERVLRDPAEIAALLPQFRLENQAAFGLAWWEERAKLGEDLEISELDELNMLLCHDLRFARRVKPRPYCPPELVGTWTSEQQTWTLRPDGTMAAIGDPDLEGARWRVHLDGEPVLYLRGRGPVSRRRIWRLSPDELELGETRWRRTSS